MDLDDIYLSSPNTKLDSHSESLPSLTYTISSMQGWRKSMVRFLTRLFRKMPPSHRILEAVYTYSESSMDMGDMKLQK